MPLNDKTPDVRNIPQARPEIVAEKETVIAAHEQAEKDMENDDDLNTRSPILQPILTKAKWLVLKIMMRSWMCNCFILKV